MTDTWYLAFTQDTTPEAATTRFREKYGREPDELTPAPGGVLFVGPLRITEQPGQPATQYEEGKNDA